jgi:D-glycero-alpha-D-manno-heptose-7-phosphate kinase
MIITRTPLRISLGGGGTDVPSYYCKAGTGFLIAAAISKYVYIAVNQNFGVLQKQGDPYTIQIGGRYIF